MMIENIDVLQQTDTTILKDGKYIGNISCAHVAKNLLVTLHRDDDNKLKLLDNNYWITFAQDITLEKIRKSINESCVTDIAGLNFITTFIICEKYYEPCQIDFTNWRKLARFKYKLLDYLYYVLIYGENFILYNATSDNPIIYRYNSNNTIQKDILDKCNSYIAHIILTPIENINVENNDDKISEKKRIISDIQVEIKTKNSINTSDAYIRAIFVPPDEDELENNIYYNIAYLISLECFRDMLIASDRNHYSDDIKRINKIYEEIYIQNEYSRNYVTIHMNYNQLCITELKKI